MSVTTGVKSPDLSAYKIPKAAQAALDRAIQLAEYMQRGGRTPPNYIRLYGEDYHQLNNAVRQQSANTYDLSQVRYRGRSLIHERDKEPAFVLEASA
jgi:hypothetical protein